MNKPDEKKKSSVPAVEKALDVLELLTDAPSGMTMNEIVDALNRTMGEIYRVVIYLAGTRLPAAGPADQPLRADAEAVRTVAPP